MYCMAAFVNHND